MARFNEQSKKTPQSRKTVNKEGAVAYSMNPEMELYTLACTSLLHDNFYESAKQQHDRIIDLVSKSRPEFVAKLGVYVREQMNLRTVPLVLSVELAKVHNGDSLVSRMLNRTIQRVDEITEILAYYKQANALPIVQKRNKKGKTKEKKLYKIAHQIKKGLQSAFNKFDEYQFSKYNRDTEIKLRDALFLIEPFPKDEKQKELFKKIASKTLQPADTWEVKSSVKQQGSKDKTEEEKLELKKDVWEEMIDKEGKGQLNYMALLRNLRNILESKVSLAHVKKACERLTNEKDILRSKQLPFRFYSAYRELEGVSSTQTTKVLDAVATAMEISCKNFVDLEGQIMVGCDVSYSMTGNTLSPRSEITRSDIACLLACMFHKKSSDTITSLFADEFRVVNLLKTNSILSNMTKLRNAGGPCGCGYATNGYKVVKHALENKIHIDHFVLFTDLQMYDADWVTYERTPPDDSFRKWWKKYKEQVNPNASLISFDCAGYGNTPLDMSEPNVYLIAGFSDKVFDMLNAMRKGSSVIEEIMKVEL